MNRIKQKDSFLALIKLILCFFLFGFSQATVTAEKDCKETFKPSPFDHLPDLKSGDVKFVFKMKKRRIREAWYEADQIRKKAYNPYSHFSVGATAIVSYTKNKKKIYKNFSGFNIENSSFSATICAERTALAQLISTMRKKAITEFKIEALVIVADKLAFPCGVCRQFLSEFASPDMKVYSANSQGDIIEKSLKDLLPYAFTSF